MGKLDNTLVIYINGDNGTSAEGGPLGTPNEVAFFNGLSMLPVDVRMKFYDVWGSDQTYNHMSAASSWAFDTPFSWFKQIASHLGGVRQGMAVSWPGHIDEPGGIRLPAHRQARQADGEARPAGAVRRRQGEARGREEGQGLRFTTCGAGPRRQRCLPLLSLQKPGQASLRFPSWTEKE